MKIIVFGGSGFLGSHVADVLTEGGHRVTIFDHRPSSYLKKGQKMVLGDIQDSEKVDTAVQGQDVVFNFAGFADIEEAQSHPLKTIQSNILGNGVILEACRKGKVRRYLFASTVYVYSDAASFYRASKLACEAYIDVYQRIHGLECTVMRFGSLFGPRATAGNGIRGYLTSALFKGQIEHWGDGDEVREYVYVRDAALSCMDALNPIYKNKCLLITGNQPVKFRDLMTMIRDILRRRVRVVYRRRHRPDLAALHYAITPYTFVPKSARKLMRLDYCDLGQGLVTVLKELESAIPGADAGH